jgi:hypothetical protein
MAASTTIGCAEHTEVTPAGQTPTPLLWGETRALRRTARLVRAPDLKASSWAKLEVPSIGPLMVTARAPLAFA